MAATGWLLPGWQHDMMVMVAGGIHSQATACHLKQVRGPPRRQTLQPLCTDHTHVHLQLKNQHTIACFLSHTHLSRPPPTLSLSCALTYRQKKWLHNYAFGAIQALSTAWSLSLHCNGSATRTKLVRVAPDEHGVHVPAPCTVSLCACLHVRVPACARISHARSFLRAQAWY